MKRKRLKQAIKNLNSVPEIIPLTLDDELRLNIETMLIENSADTAKNLFRLAFPDNPYHTYDFSEIDNYIDLLNYIKRITKK